MNELVERAQDREWVEIFSDGRVCLEGYFSADELRAIADAMDAAAKEREVAK